AEIGKIEGVKYYSAVVKFRGWANAGDQRTYAQVLGTDGSYAQIQGWSFVKGKYFKRSDVESSAPVAILGRVARDRLFGDDVNPVGKELVIRNVTFRVVGLSATNDDNQIESIFVPVTTLQKLLNISYVHS